MSQVILRAGQQVSGAVRRPFSPLVRMSISFVAAMVGFHLLLWYTVPFDGDPLRTVTIGSVSSLLGAIGIANSTDATHITLQNAFWFVTPECAACNIFILFGSFVLAYRASVKAKALALLVGLPLLFSLNVARLVTLGWATVYHPRHARFVHDYGWQAAFLLVVVVMWLIWIELVVRHEAHS